MELVLLTCVQFTWLELCICLDTSLMLVHDVQSSIECGSPKATPDMSYSWSAILHPARFCRRGVNNLGDGLM